MAKSTPIILPAHIHNYFPDDISYRYKHQSAADLIASGLLKSEEIPANRSYRNGSLKVHVTKNGLYNVHISANLALARSHDFKRFLGGLLADTRLSLMAVERYEIQKNGSPYDA